MFIPVSGRVSPAKPNRGLLTARPVVRSDDPERSESASTSPRDRHPDGHTQDPPGDQGSRRIRVGEHQRDTDRKPALFQENDVLAAHLLLQRAGQDPHPEAGSEAAYHGYEAARSMSAWRPEVTAAEPRTAPDGVT
ncbi:hypothetical protein [Leisingera sp. NJS204]|uniref:hypothetical protein n=1 Tax=Leisingera sp. NJS204 TaxID=2508307 RepID=UPI0013E95D6B|nr:hypothetical protein [Leisingera sp. NJS204]